ncbi:hypothetical protein [Kribbella deserti]|uniref:Phage tail tape measure protein n=1 Tax=Kribbella deserti TaxID=1926257 RepID=A0ABV6QVL9_9ACTN
MASKPQVTLTFAGDSSKLESTFDKVGSSARSMDREVGQAGAGFDKVGEAADGAEGKAQGFSDTLTGTKDVMGGAAEIAKGNLFEGFVMLGTGAADLAGGLASFVVPALKKTWASMMSTTVATKVMTVAQKGLNLAMRMNPIGLIVTALVLLVGGIILAYKKSETFRRVVDTAMRGIKKAFGWIVEGFGNAWRALSAGYTRFVNWIGGWKSAVTNRVKSLFSAITGAFGAAWSAVSGAWGRFTGWVGGWKGSIARWVGSLFSPVVASFGAAWSGVSGAWGRFTGWVGGWKGAITSRVSGMWSGIKDGFRGAINWVIDRWNNLSFGIPAFDTKIPGVGKVGGFSIGTPDIPRFHTGGVMPGAPGTEGLALLQAGERVKANGLRGGGEPVVVELRSSGSKVDDMLIAILQKAIRVRGGDVQVVLGR